MHGYDEEVLNNAVLEFSEHKTSLYHEEPPIGQRLLRKNFFSPKYLTPRQYYFVTTLRKSFAMSFPIFSLLAGFFLSASVEARSLILPPEDIDLVGETVVVSALHQDTLLDIARRFNVGHDEIVRANPDVDRWLPGEDAQIIIPTRHILPKTERRGVVINVPEMRLYYYPNVKPKEKKLVVTHPVSIGRMDWKTPLGETKITQKVKDPAWYPPQSIKDAAKANGEPIPEIVPPGPDNPLGQFALRLGITSGSYLIHGTNRPYGVGMRVTHGCMRMYPEDIESLFAQINVGTAVQIVNQPIKAGWLADKLFLEVHSPLDEDESGKERLLETALEVIHNTIKDRPVVVSGYAIKQAVKEQLGIPVMISR